ncbi:hypothetical protein STEG23_030261 [Scotinomys teguina]
MGWGKESADSRLKVWAAANQSWTLDPLVPASALGSWRAFLGLQDKQQRAGGLQGGQREAAAMSLPLVPQEVLQETCKAVAFIQADLQSSLKS